MPTAVSVPSTAAGAATAVAAPTSAAFVSASPTAASATACVTGADVWASFVVAAASRFRARKSRALAWWSIFSCWGVMWRAMSCVP